MEDVKNTTLRLLSYCQENDWAGHDPYDALNSRVLRMLPFLDARLPRIAFTQVLKRIPFNPRSLLLIPKTQNSKAIGIFLMALLKLDRLGLLGQEELVTAMIDKLDVLRSPGISRYCWGYSFPWQTRTVLVPQGAPNLVCTAFVANALLDAYEDGREARCLDMASSAARYILDELYWMGNESIAGFSYPLPSSRGRVHNANFLGAALFARIFKHTGDKRFIKPAMRVARYSAEKQNNDGSWYYGELPKQRWIDNFHTGYNLCALCSLEKNFGTSEFDSNISHGFSFYRRHFFAEDGAPKYFHDRVYPIDIHSVAQSLITLLELEYLDETNVELAHSVFTWAMHNMWDERGYFYYRSYLLGKNKISYMRWSQSWMLLALSKLLKK